MDDFLKDTICLATVARDFKERANIADQQYKEGQISAAEKEKILQTLDRIQCVPIVPRKMVEMIIEKCRQDVVKYNNGSEEAACIKQYAEDLLNTFEEDKDWLDTLFIECEK